VAKDHGEITILLHRWAAGDREVEQEIFERLLGDLKLIAARCLRRERPNYSLGRTELVHELYIKLAQGKKIQFADRNHFFAICTKKIKWLLIDKARSDRIEFVAMEGLPDGLFGYSSKFDLMVAINKLLDELEKISLTRSCVVVLRSYLGCTSKETAKLLGITEDVVEHEYHKGRKWLFERLREDPPCLGMGTAPDK
jgi:RNA polymerase sigma factor (TIGR02999 family)